MITSNSSKNILWWGRFDPDYSRNRILRNLLRASGYTLQDFVPRVSSLGTIEALFAKFGVPDAVWVPNFCQKDFHSARRYADKYRIPLIFDPLISAWDKAIFERKKISETNRKALKLLQWEQSMFSSADLVIADTHPHALFFMETLSAPPDKTVVIPVGAEESLFTTQPFHPPGMPPEIFFFGSFINLQGTEVIIEAAIQVPEARWTLLGQGPFRQICEETSNGHDHIRFEEWHPYEKLPERIGIADVLLGIFGSSPKSGRVIPNKVYQALACGRPLITRESTAYPAQLADEVNCGITFVPAGDPAALAGVVKKMIAAPDHISESARQARQTYEKYFCEKIIGEALTAALAKLGV
jgi:glycosyltransferase involved in cell wall biosynthesis